MEISGLEFTLDGGANITGGEITACYCADTPVADD